MFVSFTSRVSNLTMAAALSAMTMASVPAFAAPSDYDVVTVSRQVSTAGLDLTAPVDQATLRHRVSAAAFHVCLNLEAGEPIGSTAFTSCLDKVQGDAWKLAEAKIAAARGRTMVASVPK